MLEIIMSLFSTETSAQEKINIFADLLEELFNIIFGYMGVEAK